jgi:hypothetical protein
MHSVAQAHVAPQWIREAAHKVWAKSALFLRTAWDFTVRPGRFVTAWLEGSPAYQNPLGYFLTALGVLTAWKEVLQRVFLSWLPQHAPVAPSTLSQELVSAAAPFVNYVLLGLVTHVLLIRRRTPLRGSLAMALFAGGGPATAIGLLGQIIIAAGLSTRHSVEFEGSGLQTLPYLVPFCAAFAAYVVAFARSLHKLHGRGYGWIMGAIGLAFLITGCIFGLHDLDGAGLHAVVSIARIPGGRHALSFALRL